uniref:Uncharacterized protein n=1 Tax=Anguilla anguilla TaxID=7936 RepID=A0A0E9S1N8_ANGAN
MFISNFLRLVLKMEIKMEQDESSNGFETIHAKN